MDLLAFATSLTTLGLIYGLLAVGLNLQFGFAGVLNFGYVAFFAVGAFTSALATLPPAGSPATWMPARSTRSAWICRGSPGSCWPACWAALLALLIGATSVRLRTHYLAVATFAMAEVVRYALSNETWLTRGEFGISGVPQPGHGTRTYRPSCTRTPICWAASRSSARWSGRSGIWASCRSAGCCGRSATTSWRRVRWASARRGPSCRRW